MTERLSDERIKRLADDEILSAVSPWDEVRKMARELLAFRHAAPDAKDAEIERMRAELDEARKDLCVSARNIRIERNRLKCLDTFDPWEGVPEHLDAACRRIDAALSGAADPLAEARAEARREALEEVIKWHCREVNKWRERQAVEAKDKSMGYERIINAHQQAIGTFRTMEVRTKVRAIAQDSGTKGEE